MRDGHRTFGAIRTTAFGSDGGRGADIQKGEGEDEKNKGRRKGLGTNASGRIGQDSRAFYIFYNDSNCFMVF